MTTVPHIRIVAPEAHKRGDMSTIRGHQAFVTLPGEEEKKLPGLFRWELAGGVDDAQTVVLYLYATLEVEWVS